MAQIMQSRSVLSVIPRLWFHLSYRRKLQVLFTLLLMVFGAFLETVSLGAIVPFLGVLAAPAQVFDRPVITGIATFFGITSADQLLFPLAITFAILALASASVRILLLWANTQLSYTIGGEFSIESYRRTLYQPYRVHVARNTSVVISGISKKIGTAIAVLYQILILISSTVLTIAVVSTLLLIDARMTLLAAGTLGSFYILITWHARASLLENSRQIAQLEDQAIRVLQEGLGGVRDVLLDGAQELYSNKYARIAISVRQAQGKNVFIGGSPKFAMEAIGIVAIVLLAYSIAVTGGVDKFTSILPILGAFALGAQRLLPTSQQIYAAWVGIVGNHKAIIDVLEMLEQPLPDILQMQSQVSMVISHEISIDSVRYRYAADGPLILDGINITISKGARIGIVGSTGSGKSTLVDLFMGLLTPAEGQVLVDGRPITAANLRAWQKCIAHVPQSIFLTDASVAENIAFGVPPKKIDMASVRRAAKQAQLAEFIESRPEGYDAVVGERGVRLSGGQRQRIGVARALYKQAEVLVLDEATSALDNETENMVMQTIDGLDKNLTVLIVAHRLTTLKHCDRIIELMNGKAVEYESYVRFIEERQLSNSLS